MEVLYSGGGTGLQIRLRPGRIWWLHGWGYADVRGGAATSAVWWWRRPVWVARVVTAAGVVASTVTKAGPAGSACFGPWRSGHGGGHGGFSAQGQRELW